MLDLRGSCAVDAQEGAVGATPRRRRPIPKEGSTPS
jgi:hypothetical protein